MKLGKIAVVAVVAAAGLVVPGSAPAFAHGTEPPRDPTAVGYGGAVSTVDPTATAVGLDVLRRGGNAVDAAVAAAATLGVTEPFSAGVGGGGFFVYYDAKTRRVHTIDGREAAPRAMGEDAFLKADGTPMAFQEARISGISAGVPGSLLTWKEALRKWGTRSLSSALAPAADVAQRGFTVDSTFRQQIADNAAQFAQFSSTRELYLPGGQPPVVGSRFRNPDLADTYREISPYVSARSGLRKREPTTGGCPPGR